jgi:phosphatidylinositol alpha-1,6-mannosyltransferase
MRRCWSTRAGASGGKETGSFERERKSRSRCLAFAVASLARGQGGIAELSRQALPALRELARERGLALQVHVLADAAPAAGDPLFAENQDEIRWYAGRRGRFVAGLLQARPGLLLFDHVGLARLHGLVAPLLRRRYLAMIHSVEIWKSPRADYGRTAHRADLLIANSAYTARKARECYPNLPEIAVCWPGKDFESSGSVSRSADLAGIGPQAMLIVGRLDAAQRHKGHDHLLEAMPAVLARLPDAQLVVAGGGDDRARLEARARALGVAQAVVFTGRVSEPGLHELYRRAALFVMPSEGDGFGMVFLEAMMHGLPCVGLAGSAAEEILEGGSCGALVDRRDRAGMADVLAGLLVDESRRRQLGTAGHDRYLKYFTRAQYSQRLNAVLGQWLESRLGLQQ